MSTKLKWMIFFAIVAIGIAVAWHLGYVTTDQITYVATMIAGWTAWTIVIAVLYAIAEMLFPGLLRAPAHEDK